MSQHNSPIFPQQLVTALKERGMAASDLARAIGVSPTAVWNWQHGNTSPRPAALESVAAALGVTSQFLLYGPPTGDDEVDEIETVAAVLEAAKVKIAELTGISIENVKLRLEMAAD